MYNGTLTDFFSPLNNMSMQGPDQDPFDVMTVGTAREQGILTRDDRDKDRRIYSCFDHNEINSIKRKQKMEFYDEDHTNC